MLSDADEWLWGWDPTPGIVSVWADDRGRADVWRREGGRLHHDVVRFRPWLLLDRLDDLQHLGTGLGTHGDAHVHVRELEGDGALRFLVGADDGRFLRRAVLEGASRRLGHPVSHLAALGEDTHLALPPDEQFLVATGRTYFRDFAFDDLHRLQFDLETTGLDPRHDRIFMVAVRDPSGVATVLEVPSDDEAGERVLIERLVAVIREADPDVIENHNLHGFDLPFLERRARVAGITLRLGRNELPLQRRAARRGIVIEGDAQRRHRYIVPGRELIDTMDAVLRYDFSTRELPGHGLKAVARHFGLAGPDRELVRGDLIHATWRTDPERVRRYATADVEEVAGLARLLGGSAFALARMAPRRYERLADAGAATGVIDPLLVRAYLRAGRAVPVHATGDGTVHTGAALHLFAAGAAHRVVKADVASLYPSLMRTYRIGPARDSLGAFLALVDRLTEHRLAAKAAARAAPAGSPSRHLHDATSAAMKIVINSAYGYLAAGGLTRFNDVHAANEVTRRGRELLDLLCRELAARGVTLLEADTDGVYFAVPLEWTEDDERRVVAEVAALLPPLVQLEFEGRYAAMLSHEPKNYALLKYDGTLILRGVAFRSSRAEPFGEAFLREAVRSLLVGDIPAVRRQYLDTIAGLHRRDLATREVSSRVRLTKSPEQYLAVRDARKEAAYEGMLASGRTHWKSGERVRIYRAQGGESRITPAEGAEDRRDYDAEHYARVLRTNFAVRLARALSVEDWEVVFADPVQLNLFATSFDRIRTILQGLRGSERPASPPRRLEAPS
ncbi:MAG: ribonuclease H-like domain-containing protein [Gemmatimonadetes bacterium]|nr:ribonuclease H-like domain-containing protein [Gemmatimonadota bacterium]